jgi:DNA-directed RNA polymerase
MELTDIQLNALIAAGYSDDQIIQFAHENTKPADLYGAVAEVVTNVLFDDPVINELIAQDSEGRLDALKKLKKLLSEDTLFMEVAEWWKEMGITRSDTKAIVMTYLYGSTEYGNRESIQERLDKRAEECLEKALDPYWDRSGADTWKEHRTKSITLMVRLTRAAMTIVCPSTVSTMDTIQNWAYTLGEQGKPFVFSSMLGFKVTQANPNMIVKRIGIQENGKTVMTLHYRVPAQDGNLLSARKMKSGAAPNFVHMHDACHMQVTVLKADTEYFHLIHDSYATQCADTPNLDSSIRSAFCDMYEDTDVLQTTRELNKGDSVGLRQVVKRGALKLLDVVKSRYFFS